MVIKVGGNELDNPEFLRGLAHAVTAMAARPVIVHGGGRGTTALIERFGGSTRFLQGLRVTDPQTLELAVMGLVGKASMQLVSALVRENIPALGLSGVDAALVRARRVTLPEGDLGAVGEPVGVNGAHLESLLEAGFLPCIASICIDEAGEILNVNADQVAQAVAGALGVERLIFLTDVRGITLAGVDIGFITPDEIESAIGAAQIVGGMIPKSRAAAAAIRAGVQSCVITNLEGLIDISRGKPAGTTIIREEASEG